MCAGVGMVRRNNGSAVGVGTVEVIGNTDGAQEMVVVASGVARRRQAGEEEERIGF